MKGTVKDRPQCRYFCPKCKWLSNVKPKRTFKRLCPKCDTECLCSNVKETPEEWKTAASNDRYNTRRRNVNGNEDKKEVK